MCVPEPATVYGGETSPNRNYWEAPECTVVRVAGFCYLPLDLEKFAVIDPNTRHFVHEHKSPFKRVVDGLIRRVSYAFVLYSVSAFSEVHIP